MKKSVNIPLYGGKLHVHITDDMENTLDEVGYSGELDCDACCLYNTDGCGSYDLIFKKKQLQHGIISHECFHLTMRIMRSINKAYDVKNDEPEAYLLQYLVDETYRAIKEMGGRVK